jgi:hypothetical protein
LKDLANRVKFSPICSTKICVLSIMSHQILKNQIPYKIIKYQEQCTKQKNQLLRNETKNSEIHELIQQQRTATFYIHVYMTISHSSKFNKYYKINQLKDECAIKLTQMSRNQCYNLCVHLTKIPKIYLYRLNFHNIKTISILYTKKKKNSKKDNIVIC